MNRPVEKRTKCAIVGFASSSRDQAPYKDESCDIWSLNHAYNHVPRWDAWLSTKTDAVSETASVSQRPGRTITPTLSQIERE